MPRRESYAAAKPAIAAFEKWEKTVGSPWRQERLQGNVDTTFVHFGFGKEFPE
jgi:hypothetical protein